MCVPAVIILRVCISVGLCGRVCLHINMDIFSIYINLCVGLCAYLMCVMVWTVCLEPGWVLITEMNHIRNRFQLLY